MFCPKCGKESADGVKFCTFCGNKMPEMAAPAGDNFANAAEPATPDAPQFANGEFAPQPPVFCGPAPLIRSIICSPKYLVALIAYTVYAIYTLLGGSSVSYSAQSSISTVDFALWLNEIGLPANMWDMINNFRKIVASITLVSAIPMILVVIGGWILFASAKNRQADRLSPAGMKVIHVSTIITLIFTCISCVSVIGLTLFSTSYLLPGDLNPNATLGIIFGADEELITFVIAVIVGILIVLAITYAFLIPFAAKAKSTVKTLKIAIETNTVGGKISSYVIGLCYVSGVLNALCTLLYLGSFTTVLSTITSAVAMFCFGMLLSDYKKAVYR